MRMINLTREQWIQYGVRHGFCSSPFCEIHEGGPIADSEGEAFEEGGDPCMVYVRIGTQAEWEKSARDYLDIFTLND